ncbi:MAG: pentapeptide repeat-containing protein [Cyanobacteria bacterium]|nr:pentapeptide repeat-containing protein [Cyanobacteriota bacterium]
MLKLQLNALEQILMSTYRNEMSIYIQVGDFFQELVIDHVNSRRQGRTIEVCLKSDCGYSSIAPIRVSSIEDAFRQAAKLATAGKPQLETVSAPDVVLPLARKAFADVLGIPNDESLSNSQEEICKLRQELLSDALLKLLEEGPAGIEAWNSRSTSEKKDIAGISLAGRSFANMELESFNMEGLNAEGAKFDGANMPGAYLNNATINKASFRKAHLDGTNISNVWSNSVDYTDASMKRVYSYDSSFKKAKFKNADLSDSTFREADFTGADFTGADTTNMSVDNCKFDEKTVLAPSMTGFSGLVWKGKDKNPLINVAELKAEVDCQTVEELIDRLSRSLDSSKMEKAMKMLKKDSFQLYSELDYNKISGIVRSQTDEELVYACSLDEDGNYCCCTQNLKSCGGLKGSICKHLLVLLVGLAKSGAIDCHQAACWSIASSALRAKLNRENMAALFIKFQGALAGDIDWRPTETMPEDYYSF